MQLDDGRTAVVDELSATKQYLVDSSPINAIRSMRAVFATKKVGEQDVRISTPVDYGKALDLIGDSLNLNRIATTFDYYLSDRMDDAEFIESSSGGTVTVKLFEGGTAVMKMLSSRMQSIADELTPNSNLVLADTRCLCAIVELDGQPVSIAAQKDLANLLSRLGSGRNLDRLIRTYAATFSEVLDLPNV